jgi:hypothetical protein
MTESLDILTGWKREEMRILLMMQLDSMMVLKKESPTKALME